MSGFASGSRLGSCPGSCLFRVCFVFGSYLGSCLVRNWLVAGFAPGSCLGYVWVSIWVRVWFAIGFGFVFGFVFEVRVWGFVSGSSMGRVGFVSASCLVRVCSCLVRVWFFIFRFMTGMYLVYIWFIIDFVYRYMNTILLFIFYCNIQALKYMVN